MTQEEKDRLTLEKFEFENPELSKLNTTTLAQINQFNNFQETLMGTDLFPLGV
jgi:hypothetical protein